MFNSGVFSGLYFPVFGLNTEIYSVILHIQSKHGKIWTIKNSLFGPFSHSNSNHWDIILSILLCVIVNIFRKLFGKIFKTVIIKTSLRVCFFFCIFILNLLRKRKSNSCLQICLLSIIRKRFDSTKHVRSPSQKWHKAITN